MGTLGALTTQIRLERSGLNAGVTRQDTLMPFDNGFNVLDYDMKQA